MMAAPFTAIGATNRLSPFRRVKKRALGINEAMPGTHTASGAGAPVADGPMSDTPPGFTGYTNVATFTSWGSLRDIVIHRRKHDGSPYTMNGTLFKSQTVAGTLATSGQTGRALDSLRTRRNTPGTPARLPK